MMEKTIVLTLPNNGFYVQKIKIYEEIAAIQQRFGKKIASRVRMRMFQTLLFLGETVI